MDGAAPELSEQRLALVVATTTYADPGLRQLRSPAQDAADMADVLAAPNIGGFTVTQVVDRPEYEIRRSIDDFLADRALDDLVLVYLSCHGVLDARGRLYFAAEDTSKARLSSTAVESTWLLDRLEDCRARRQVLILDCCFSGAFAGTKGGADIDLERRLIGAGRGRAVLTASRAGEYSFEGKPLADGTEPGSVFTAGLVDGLRSGKADGDGDGYVTVEDAYAYAAAHVQENGGTQSPQRWLYGGEDAIVLARNPHGATISAAPLPDALRISLESPYPDVRRGAVRATGDWLASTDPREILAAQQTLHRIASEDIPSVAAEARELLAGTEEPKPPAPARITARPHARPDTQFRHILTIKAVEKGAYPSVREVAFSPNGELLASAGNDQMIRLWDPDTGQPIGAPLDGHTGDVDAIAFSPDGDLLASASGDGTVRLWDPSTGQPLGAPLEGNKSQAFGVAFSPDGRMLANGGQDKSVRRWIAATGQPAGAPLTGNGGSVFAVAFSPDGHYLASAGQDGTVRLWNPESGEPARTIAAHAAGVNRITFSPDGRLLTSAGRDGTVKLWNPITGEAAGRVLPASRGWAKALSFSPDGRLLASGGEDKTVKLWDPATGRSVSQPLQGHTKPVLTVAFSPDGRLLASGSIDGTVRIWATT